MAKKLNSRATAAKLAWQTIDQGQSLSHAFDDVDQSDRALVQELVYGLCRWYGELNQIAGLLLKSPIRKKDRIVHFILLTGLYQLRHLQTAQHAAVAETVNACKQLKKEWSKNLINGCLRTYLRKVESAEISSLHQSLSESSIISHPDWIQKEIKQAWPEHAENIFNANNTRPPMCLRVNSMRSSQAEYLLALKAKDIAANKDEYCRDGIILDNPLPVVELPNFYDGDVSVQDTAAQLAVDFLDVESNHTILDACAAPGGKTAHILERTKNSVALTALDISKMRCDQLQETLQRLNLTASVYQADASQSATWNVPKDGYDRILIDAPCSGLGVIRRHPDIKHHRRKSDIATLTQIQLNLLNNLYKLLKPGGKLLYMTCSILPDENEELVSQFLTSINDVMLKQIHHPNAIKLVNGVQILPGVNNMDGFYYSLMQKT